jgi:excisionase family DNA binding protein
MAESERGKLLSTAEVAERLGLSQRMVQLLIKEGEIPAFRASIRVWRVREADLEEYIRQRSNRPPPPPE